MSIAAASTGCAVQAANYDESKVGEYALPPLMVARDSTTVTTPKEWEERRRPEILEDFRQHVYGHTPERPKNPSFEVLDEKRDALEGLATRRQVRIYALGDLHGPAIDLLLYTPNAATRPAPVFLGLNFYGNHAITTESDVRLSTSWMRPVAEKGIVDNRATSASRGVQSNRWPLRQILSRGYAVGTAYYGDLEPDHPEGWKTSLRGALMSDGGTTTAPGLHDWGAIGAWAWGLSAMLDYCETDPRIDAKRAITIGHSRLGKTALWAAAQDTRIAMAISNNSGEGGAALARRNYGETVAVITKSFPHWFAPHYATYAQRVNELPVDQHMLIALMAPRPIYIASATGDKWADPLGEFLAGVHAAPAYELYGQTGLGTTQQPAADQPVGHHIGYHLRTGKHDITLYDWQQYLDFADRHLSDSK